MSLILTSLQKCVNMVTIGSDMPQKTRKEKIAASIRREYKLREVPPRQEPVQTASTSNDTYAITEEDTTIRTYFIHDLRKSLILIGTIFTLEFLLYYATINNYFKF